MTATARILLPFTESTLSAASLDEALRLARDRAATLVPACIVIVPAHLSLEAPAPVSAMEAALPVLELIEQRAAAYGVPVDERIERGRTHRDALAALLEAERFDAVVAPPESFSEADLEWLVARAGGEVLRAPGPSAAAT